MLSAASGTAKVLPNPSYARTDTKSRREHVSLVVGFGRLDLRLGSSIWVYGSGGRASAAHRASPYEKVRIRLDRLMDGRAGFEVALFAKGIDRAGGNPGWCFSVIIFWGVSAARAPRREQRVSRAALAGSRNQASPAQRHRRMSWISAGFVARSRV